MLNPEDWLIVAVVMLIAGSVKGIAGLGLPTIAVSLMVFFFDAHQALGLIVLPLLFSNMLQAWQSGQFRWVLTNFWPFLAAIAITIFIASSFANQVNERIIYLLIAIGILLFLVSQKKLPSLSIENSNHSIYAGFAGCCAGLLGGLTTVWGPPTVIYLRLINLDKEQFVRAAGWMFLIGGIPLTLGYWFGGILTSQMVPVGLVGSIAAMLGVVIGKQFRPKISEKRFVLIIDIILALMAVNLLRKALGY